MSDNTQRKKWAKIPLPKVFIKMIEVLGLGLFVGLILATICLAVFIWLADKIFSGSTMAFDESIRDWVHQVSSPTLTQLMILASFIGSFSFLFPLGILVFLILLYLRRKRALILFLLTMAGELSLEPVLKNFFHRARPTAFFDYLAPASYSFPSGHAFAALCFFGILAWLITSRLQNILLRVLIWVFAILLIFWIGISRVYLGVHYPTDIIAGYLTAFVWVMTIALGDLWFRRRKDQNPAASLKM
ncbi:MAG TPA: phosphatase PAP2 family protein [Pyrinomonadaceae bacterium]|jgi:undecaprenyl-diphosphatase|nr:phosphatase PAP2 family protein [Pyrinomonadaceae bacterium]